MFYPFKSKVGNTVEAFIRVPDTVLFKKANIIFKIVPSKNYDFNFITASQLLDMGN